MIEIKKVVIPKFVAEAMQGYEDLQMMLGEEYYSVSSEEIGNDDVQWWIDENFETLCKAWLDGYEIEKEKLYYVELPEKKETLNARVLKKHPNREIGFGLVDKLDLETATQIRLTEQEIRSIDERYWAFAVEVEGEE